MLKCTDQLCSSALTSFMCIQVDDCCVVLRVGWPVKSCSTILTSFTGSQVDNCCLVWWVSWPVKSCVSALTSLTCCQAHDCCLVLRISWPVRSCVECTDQLYMLSGSRLLSGVEKRLAGIVAILATPTEDGVPNGTCYYGFIVFTNWCPIQLTNIEHRLNEIWWIFRAIEYPHSL